LRTPYGVRAVVRHVDLLFGIGRFGRADGPHRLVAPAAEPLLGAVGDVPQPQTARLAAGVAIVHDVRTLDRPLQVQPSPLRALGVTTFDVLPHLVDALNHDLTSTVQDLDDRPGRRRCIIPGHDDHLVTLLDLHDCPNPGCYPVEPPPTPQA